MVVEMMANDLELARRDALLTGTLEPTNLFGSGEDCSIRELAETVKCVTGYSGEIVFDAGKPDGAARKLMDVSRLQAMGWRHRVPPEQGLRETYDWYLANQPNSVTNAHSPA